MSFSLFNTPIKSNYIIANYISKKIDNNKYFISTKHGPWIILNSNDFKLLKTNKLSTNLELMHLLYEKKIILNQNNFLETAQIQSNMCHNIFHGPTLHIITPTLRCTNKCVYCHSKAKDENKFQYDMDEETAKKTVDFIFDSPSKFFTIEFQGGEPLLNFDIVRYIIEYSKIVAKQKNKYINFALVSNFVKMDSDILDYLMENKVGINTSLDGPKHIHDKNRKRNGNGTYETVVYWIDYLVKEKKYHSFNALPTFTKYSLDWSKEIVNEYIERGFKTFFVRYLNRAGFAKQEWAKIGYTSDEFIKFWKTSLEYIIELNKKNIEIKERWSQIILSKLIHPTQEGYTCLGSPCGATFIQMAYESNGDIYSCDESRSVELFKIGNVKKHNYAEVINSPNVQTIRTLSSGLMTTCDSCVWHPYCGVCLVNLYNSTQNINANPKQEMSCPIKSKSIEYLLNKISTNNANSKILLDWLD